MKQKIIFFICLLFGLIFINAGLNKFFNYMPVPDSLPEEMIKMGTAIMEIGWLLPLVAVAEITGGTLFIIPKLRPLGAIVIFPVMIGIVLTNLAAAPSGRPLALGLFVINLAVIFDNRKRYLTVIR